VDLGGASLGAGRICTLALATVGHHIPAAPLLAAATVADMALEVATGLAQGSPEALERLSGTGRRALRVGPGEVGSWRKEPESQRFFE